MRLHRTQIIRPAVNQPAIRDVEMSISNNAHMHLRRRGEELQLLFDVDFALGVCNPKVTSGANSSSASSAGESAAGAGIMTRAAAGCVTSAVCVWDCVASLFLEHVACLLRPPSLRGEGTSAQSGTNRWRNFFLRASIAGFIR